jgi:hypothetical protein
MARLLNNSTTRSARSSILSLFGPNAATAKWSPLGMTWKFHNRHRDRVQFLDDGKRGAAKKAPAFNRGRPMGSPILGIFTAF